MKPRLAACGIAVILVAACGGESHQDLRAWMQDQGKGVKGKLDPLPQVRPYEPFTYNAFDLSDPFKPRKIEPVQGRQQARAGSQPAQGAARSLSAGIAADGRHACSGARARTRWSERPTGTSIRSRSETTWGRTSASSSVSGTAIFGSRNWCRTVPATGRSEPARSSSPKRTLDRSDADEGHAIH